MKKLLCAAVFAIAPSFIHAGIVGDQFRITDSTAAGKIIYTAGTFVDSMRCGDTTIYSHGKTDGFIFVSNDYGAVLWAFAIGTAENDTVKNIYLSNVMFRYPVIGVVSYASLSELLHCDDALGGMILSPFGTTNVIGKLVHYVSYHPYKPNERGQYAGIAAKVEVWKKGQIIN